MPGPELLGNRGHPSRQSQQFATRFVFGRPRQTSLLAERNGDHSSSQNRCFRDGFRNQVPFGTKSCGRDPTMFTSSSLTGADESAVHRTPSTDCSPQTKAANGLPISFHFAYSANSVMPKISLGENHT